VLEQAIYLVEAGLLLFIYLFAAHYHLIWGRQQHGIALGLSISACVGLGAFATFANRVFFEQRYYLDFLFITFASFSGSTTCYLEHTQPLSQ
jgi:hypothetical protein